jgi:hypothetical protein
VGGDPAEDALQRIAATLEGIDRRQKEEADARAEKTAEDNRRESIALVTIGITALLVVLSASNVASRFAPFAQQLKDYQPFFAIGLTIVVALIYRAFQLRVIALEIVVGLCLGVMVVAGLTLTPALHSGPISAALFLAFAGLTYWLFRSVKWDFGAERAALITICVVLLILWGAGLITTSVGGAAWLQIRFVGQVLLIIDSAFPKLALLDVLVSAATVLLLLGLFWRWTPFRRFLLEVMTIFDVETHDRDHENVVGWVLATAVGFTVMLGLVSNNPFTGIAHMPWPLVG